MIDLYIIPNKDSKNLDEDLIYENSLNGIMINNDNLHNSGYPNSIWDAGLKLINGSLVISGGTGACGYGSAEAKFPIETFSNEDDENLFFYIEPTDENSRNIIINHLDSMGWDYKDDPYEYY